MVHCYLGPITRPMAMLPLEGGLHNNSAGGLGDRECPCLVVETNNCRLLLSFPSCGLQWRHYAQLQGGDQQQA